MRKLLILLIKFIPIIQMVGMLVNNTMYYYDIYWFSYLLDFTIGNSIIMLLLIVCCSYVFQFCVWHRLIITANLINLIIANIDNINKLPISDLDLLLSYYLISSIFIILATYTHIKCNNEHKIKDN